MADYLEVEVKILVPDLEAARHTLEAGGAVLESPRVLERNLRFSDVQGHLWERGAVLRLRQDTRARLTYKEGSDATAPGRSNDSGIRSRFEAEVEVSDFAAMETILARLGFLPYMTYEKYRTTYTFMGAEIVLDELPYGNFVEIESDEATIEALLERFGWHDAPRVAMSYTSLFNVVKQKLSLPFEDLTFANFTDVQCDLKRIIG